MAFSKWYMTNITPSKFVLLPFLSKNACSCHFYVHLLFCLVWLLRLLNLTNLSQLIEFYQYFLQDFTLSMIIHLEWKDSRLEFSHQLNMSKLEMDVKMMKYIWVPDFYIVNEKHSFFHKVPFPSKLMHIYSDGTIIYKLR